MIALRTPWVPQQAHLLAPSALCMRAPSTPMSPRLHTKSAVAPEGLRALAPAILIDTLIAILAHRIAQVVSLLKTVRALANHLSDISESCLQPACFVTARTYRLLNRRRGNRMLIWMFLLCLRWFYQSCWTRLFLKRRLKCFQGLFRCFLRQV